MGNMLAHFRVIRECLLAPEGLQPARWITEGDFDARSEPFCKRASARWTREQWAEFREQGYRFCGHFQDGRLLSMAGVWPRERDVWEVIGVGTRDGYMRCGQGKCVVCLAAEYIILNGRVASYTTSPDNIASIRTAQSVGFKRCTSLVANEKWCAMTTRPVGQSGSCPLASDRLRIGEP
jgi:RimJ/RimL family protein N-acetyltransferase